jgi:hypothetical protein
MSGEPKAHATQMDVLGEVLRLAGQEGGLEGDRLTAFTAALKERAALVVQEVEARLEALERENTWRREAMATLEQSQLALKEETTWRRATADRLEEENAWRREAMGALEQSQRALEEEAIWRRATADRLEEENAWRRESQAQMEKEAEWLRTARAGADDAHGRLVSHHRGVLERVAAELCAVAALPFWRRRAARRRLLALAALIREETR